MSDLVIVGSGIAGLTAALRAGRRHRVTLVTKGPLLDGSTRYAQGGIAAAMSPDDSVEAHIRDTLRAGAGLGDPAAVAALCAEGPSLVGELVELGVPFDREDGELARGHEAAHSVRRVIHAGGDATGLAIHTTLITALRAAPVRILEHAFLDDLVADGGGVRGVRLLGPNGAEVLSADAVLLATGGAGQLYRHTTNPPCATGDGMAAAARAGARLRDLEFIQFHPTALAAPGSPLISEAVRGDGARLLDADGRRFMPDAHPDAELAPRDVVARAIAAVMARQDGAPVYLDARPIGADRLVRRFPSITRMLLAHGIDWTAEPVPVTPAAHYVMGGVATDVRGRTGIRGLYAVGEVACTRVHGANRLASNSLLEALVFSARAADDLDTAVGWRARPAGRLPEAAADGGERVAREQIQKVMWNGVGLYRDREGLERAQELLTGWRAGGASVADRETANLLQLARLVTAAALARRTSRGAHFRVDAGNAEGFGRVLTGAARTAVPAC
ncbi:L-aspartate oxidase [Lysobacter korlensis]|uniref:L-aspartate oxidase n=1 Tax=Lysobacter korlensis TaxID=553636 RepID=A0ABV6RMK2_9GAMM